MLGGITGVDREVFTRSNFTLREIFRNTPRRSILTPVFSVIAQLPSRSCRIAANVTFLLFALSFSLWLHCPALPTFPRPSLPVPAETSNYGTVKKIFEFVFPSEEEGYLGWERTLIDIEKTLKRGEEERIYVSSGFRCCGGFMRWASVCSFISDEEKCCSDMCRIAWLLL
jgi:hypothetical protein